MRVSGVSPPGSEFNVGIWYTAFVNPFQKFNAKSLDDPLPFTPEGFQGGGFVFNYKKHGLSKRIYMSRPPVTRVLNAMSFAVINLGIPIGVAIYCGLAFMSESSWAMQLVQVAIVVAALVWAWITLPYTIFFVRIVRSDVGTKK